MRVITLKRRPQFLRVRGGARWATSTFVLETKPGTGSRGRAETADAPHFGFTVTKKLGDAVVRNRIRRRLKEAVRSLPDGLARHGHDYVLVARAKASTCTFAHLQGDLAVALDRVHQALKRVSTDPPGNGSGPATGPTSRAKASPPGGRGEEHKRSPRARGKAS